MTILPVRREITCNLCGNSSSKIRYDSTTPGGTEEHAGHYLATTDLYGNYGQILECKACGLVFAAPRLADSEILSLYAKSEDEEYRDEGASRSINSHFSLNTILRFVRAGKLLDIGCSTGFFLNAARLFFEVQGVEPSLSASQYARDRLLIDVHTGTLETAKILDNSFGIASMIDVVEHFSDPLSALKQAYRVLEPGGYLYLVTPDISSLAARLLGKKWWGLRPAHLYYFSPASLRAMVEKAGFEVVMVQSFGRSFTGRYWISRLRNYSPFFTGMVMRAMDRLGLLHKIIYINTFDSIELCARKKGGHEPA